MRYWIGQLFGLAGTATGISIPVFNKKWQMLIMSITTNIFCALNLIFLDEIGSGIFLFAVASVQALMNLLHVRRNTETKPVENAVFLVLYLASGFYGLLTAPGYVPGINAHNLLELLPIAAAVMNMLFVCSSREKTARIFFISCNFLWTVYYVIIGSSSILGSAFSVASGLFALYKNRAKK